MSKSTEMNKFLNEMTNITFGRERETSISTRMCVTCGNSADYFRDTLSMSEYNISGMCQVCQDRTFGS
jgi:uncharacterized CHY-type Zn-finger protein